ncbi:MAG: glycine C-acetyltransferase [Candidatus Delongbacteria bacterium]|nr:glycine C-acetyltransferase [Candidatus Delongbacteria bacterium]
MYKDYTVYLAEQLDHIRREGLFKAERLILSDQKALIRTAQGEVINFCANNYLGLANHPDLIRAARECLDRYGYGLSSVRFICGTQDIHKQLERKIADFLHMDDAILYSSCFDANGGLFETLLGEEDAIISDELNHASIIDGIRLCKAQRYRYKNNDMNDLEARLKEAAGARFRLIATDGVFSMDGYIARLDQICDLADRYHALVMVDDSHATGFVGQTGRGTTEYNQVMGRVDIITSTLGKALGGASGGFTAARREIVDYLRQRSRPYLFSNTVSPAVVGASLKVFDLLQSSNDLITHLNENTAYFRAGIQQLGFTIRDGVHPIVPVMLGEARLASDMANMLLDEGIYVIGFSYPVVPKGLARIRLQISAAHQREHLDRCLNAFAVVGKKLNII